MNATVKIDIGVQTQKRMHDEPFKPTRAWTNTFAVTTDLESYADVITALAEEVYQYVVSERSQGGVPTTHVAVWLENRTHPALAAGVVPLPKGHRDTSLDSLSFSSSDILHTHLSDVIANLKQNAKY